MKRIPEPEIMSSKEEARVYREADFSEVNQAFACRVLEIVPQTAGVLIDLGCGPGDILIRTMKFIPRFFFIGLDASTEMIKLAVEEVKKNQYSQKIFFLQGDAKKLSFTSQTFDVIISNSLVHHLLDPLPLWEEVKRVIKPGGTVLFRDLCRPSTPEAAWEIVEKYSGNEPSLLKTLFFNSLNASFTLDEIKGQLTQTGILGLSVKMCSDRHWEVAGKIEHLS
ncbi:MAG: class I SAM-dependent methyltransferase [Desulfobacterota bacterium]|nr:class I SAM-dependent methyltransferase [Thermodesulfobacteriota bacterium]